MYLILTMLEEPECLPIPQETPKKIGRKKKAAAFLLLGY
jgi:hypothetical protein